MSCLRAHACPVVASRPVRRILCRTLRSGGGHPSRPAVTRRLQRPTRESTGGPPSPCLALLPVGFTEPPGSPRALVRSYRTVSPLPVRPANPAPSAVCSLLHCPAGHPDWVLPSTVPCGVRTFLGRSPGAGPYAATRPTRHRLTIQPRHELGGQRHAESVAHQRPHAPRAAARRSRPRARDTRTPTLIRASV